MSSIWTVRRSTTDTKVAGLCGGVAQHWGVDPVLVRVGWAVLALSGGIGVVLYLAGWLLIPVDGRQPPVHEMFGEATRRWPREVWVVLVVLACVGAFAIFGSVSPFGVGPAIVIAIIWYFGFYSKRRPPSPAPRAAAEAPTAAPVLPFVTFSGPPTAFTVAAEAWQRRVEEHQRTTATGTVGTVGTVATATSTAAPLTVPPLTSAPLDHRPPEPEWPSVDQDRLDFLAAADPVGLYAEPEPLPVSTRARRDGRAVAALRLRWVGLLTLGLTMSGLALAARSGTPVSWPVYVAAALLVVGLTLLAGTWFGRARGILPVGVLLALALAATGAPSVVTAGPGWANSTVAFRTVGELPAAGNSLDSGRLTVDLSQLAVTSDSTYRAHVDAGRLTVIVPKDATVTTRYHLDFGTVRMYGHEVRTGPEQSGTETEPPAGPTSPGSPGHTLTLDLSLDAGQLTVLR